MLTPANTCKCGQYKKPADPDGIAVGWFIATMFALTQIGGIPSSDGMPKIVCIAYLATASFVSWIAHKVQYKNYFEWFRHNERDFGRE